MSEHVILNVTHNGISQDLESQVHVGTPDSDIQRIAAETLGLRPDVFVFFVVDRFPETGRFYLRPKVPFG